VRLPVDRAPPTAYPRPVRIVAGTYKGHRISAPKGASTRPTADRVREAVFNLLGPLDGLRVIDLYAGSGALGIEALSRGAASATFVDSDRGAARVLRENVEQLSLERARVVRADVQSYLRAAARAGERWDLAFCDPPYRLAHRLGAELGGLLRPVLAEGAQIVCESSQRQPLELDLPMLKQRRYGETVIAIYRSDSAEGVRGS
jgi:16S rRNA (guanine966-N2)-methyltransferase